MFLKMCPVSLRFSVEKASLRRNTRETKMKRAPSLLLLCGFRPKLRVIFKNRLQLLTKTRGKESWKHSIDSLDFTKKFLKNF